MNKDIPPKDCVTITLSDSITLHEALKNAGVTNSASVTKLTVTGTFNYVHFSDIFANIGSLRELDLSHANYNAYFIKRDDYYAYIRNEKRYKDLWISDYSDTLDSISFPSSVSKLSPELFSRFRNLTSIAVQEDHEFYSTENGLLFSKDKTKLVRYPTGYKGEYRIPETVVEIGNYAFAECTGLTSIVIPKTVVKIEDNAFYKCTGLTTLIIPESVVEIENYVFYECKELKSLVIPESVVKIGNCAFYECKCLTSLIIPESVVEIGNTTFQGCKGLTSISIPLSVEKIGDYAFSDCSGLKSVKISNPAVKLGICVFSYCSELTSVDMPKSVKYKRNDVFSYCNKLPLYIEQQKEEENKQIKQGKIKKLKETSAYDWVDNLMKNSKYSYKINDDYTNRLQLSVMINDKMKLEIPVPYKHFQQILPRLMDAIQYYETSINKFDFVFIESMAYDKEGWITKHLT